MEESLQLFKGEIKENSSFKRDKLTPMMEQYWGIKSAYPNCLIFYRLGDFYELFYEDAKLAAQILDIALTKRGKQGENDIPMCGVPYHASENYLAKLIKAGYKVAICEQLESPIDAKKRGYKEVVKRDIVRIVTPGTVLEDNLLDGKSSNYILSLVYQNNNFGIAWADISTGEFYTQITNIENLPQDIARIRPAEIIISDKLYQNAEIKNLIPEDIIISPNVQSFFGFGRALRNLGEFYGEYNIPTPSPANIVACGSLIEYITLTQKNSKLHLNLPQIFSQKNFMQIDKDTRKNLEIFTNLSSCSSVGSLFGAIDKTVTNAGARLLKRYLSSPLMCEVSINERLDVIEFFVNSPEIRDRIRKILSIIPDIERSLTRICADKGGPRDLQVIQLGIKYSCELRMILENNLKLPPLLLHWIFQITDNLASFRELKKALAPQVPVLARDGNFILNGYDANLDHQRNLRDNGHNKILELRDQYRIETNIPTLKIEFNNQLGYFIEVTPSHTSKMNDKKFILRQNLANNNRYYTEILKELEVAIMQAADRAKAREIELFDKLRNLIIIDHNKIALLAEAVAFSDLSSGLAELAVNNNYIRPIIDKSSEFKIIEGRHPVVENYLSQRRIDFIPNNINFNDKEWLSLITGPNMAGKSTFLRQNAVIAILAQIGSFIPAKFAHIGIIDALFSRVGASDNLAQGKSTFMVEMAETANILNNATIRSFIIIDEIGRGTATYDGMSIAWAVLEHIHNNLKCRTIFATHYHELINLSKNLSGLQCYSMRVKEWEGEIIFKHEVVKGPADKSYGIYVAKLAGIPLSVLKCASDTLEKLENNVNPAAYTQNNNSEILENKYKEIIDESDIENITPLEALNILYKLKNLNSYK